MTTIAPYFATKYDSAAHEVIAILADHAEGYGQGFGGNIDAPTGYFELVILDESHDADFHDHTNYPPGDYAGEVARRHGVQADDVMGNWLVLTNAQGFVSVIGHPTPDAARAAFAQLEAQWIDYASHTAKGGNPDVHPHRSDRVRAASHHAANRLGRRPAPHPRNG